MNDPWTWTIVWGLTVEAWVELDRGGQRRENWENCNRITITKKKKKGNSN